MKFLGLMLPVAMLLSSCGTGTNFNKIWGGDDEGADSWVAEAKAAYDAKDYDRAEKLTTKLLERNPDNESAAIILGYTMLSRGGIEPIELARELIKLNSSSTTSDTTGGNQLQSGGSSTSSSSSSDSATSTLQQLGSLINLTDADFENLSEKKFDKDSNGGVEPTLFAADSNPLYVPAKVSDELRAKVPVLGYMNSAIKAICRFVDSDAKVDGETRHQDASCTQTTGPRVKTAKTHFLWAFAHLTEALVYQSVILYSGASETSNFQSASDSINTKDYGTDIAKFVTEVSEMKNAVDTVFDTTSADSMITATLLNLDTVQKAFSLIAGLPDGISAKISESLNQINKVSQTLGDTSVQGNTSALKGQMTEKMASTIGEKIDNVGKTNPVINGKTYQQVLDDDSISDSDKEPVLNQVKSLCGGYDSLAKGLPPEKNKKPSTCTGVPSN